MQQVTDRVRSLPFRILGYLSSGQLLALRYMVSPHTVTPSGALRYTHTHTHARTVRTKQCGFFLEDGIPFTVCSNCTLICRQLFDLPVHLNYRQY